MKAYSSVLLGLHDVRVCLAPLFLKKFVKCYPPVCQSKDHFSPDKVLAALKSIPEVDLRLIYIDLH